MRAARLARLRAALANRGLAGFVVPRADAHQGEYVAPHAERLAWLTGFTGSAGQAVVLAARAALFVDGRYTLQTAAQVDEALFEIHNSAETRAEDWVAAHLGAEERLGYDPWLHTVDGVAKLAAACEKAGGALVALADNPVDALWADQPAPPRAPIVPHPLDYAGKPAAEKRCELGAALSKAGVDVAILTMPDSVAWLLNIRGGDVPHVPVAHVFALLHGDGGVALFGAPEAVSDTLRAHLGDEVRLAPKEELGPALDALGQTGRAVRLDPMTAAAWVEQRLRAAGARVVRDMDPCALPKACKNEVELAGARAAHRRDGAALTRFLAWIAAAAPAEGITERAAAERLYALRAEDPMLRDLSFDTISGAGPNGAIVHYRVSAESDRALAPGTLYLVDSGAQYPDGTTDVTRTVAIGTPDAEMRDRFTRVLKGHIALATACFPEGTTGSQLDALARRPLWRAGLDYDHGTGHGVGSYLSVHEGPQRISKQPNRVALRPGMICSNEPGYYKTGAYGIRIENLVAVREAEAPAGAERTLLEFETLTLAPIDRALIAADLMTADEIVWLDAYHARVRAVLTPLLDAATADWLEGATAPILCRRAP